MKIAVIIPAFKPEHLNEAIKSILEQSNQNFHLYVGDDAGPDEIFQICKGYTHLNNFTYARFDANIGKDDLIASWARSVSLSQDEDYIWVFSDDDRADPSCIEAALDCVEDSDSNPCIVNFNTRVIDCEGNVTTKDPTLPNRENSLELARRILEGRMLLCMQSQIFSRDTYVKKGGIVNFPFGQASDWATAIHFASINGIRHLSNTFVYWRNSGSNITAIAHKNNTTAKAKGHLQFHNWLSSNFKDVNDSDFQSLILKNLRSVFLYHYRSLPLALCPAIIRSLKQSNSKSIIHTLYFILEIRATILKRRVKAACKNI